jgi:alpha-amylase
MGRTVRAVLGLVLVAASAWLAPARAAEQPTAIFHAHDQYYSDVQDFVCAAGRQGYSHVQIAPPQKSNPAGQWWARYQPIDYRVIEGRGSEADLKALVDTAHGCGVKVIADVVLNHMADLPEYKTLHFPTFGPADFQPYCPTDYNDKATLHRCWLGSLPDLDVTRAHVQAVHKQHLQALLALGVDGFRFDAAKHMPQAALQTYVDVANTRDTWNYLEVIEDGTTHLEEYDQIAAVTDFRLYNTLHAAFSYGGDLRTLRVPVALGDARSVTFGRNHDTAPDITDRPINPYLFTEDAHLATAYVLARESGTPLVLNIDNASVPFIKYGVRFRQIMRDRGREGRNVHENVLAVLDSPTVLVMERGSEGLFIVNKGVDKVDVPVLDVTLTNLEGCYRELRNGFAVAVERRSDGKKYVTRWGTRARGGAEVYGRDVLYLVREPWEQCQ